MDSSEEVSGNAGVPPGLGMERSRRDPAAGVSGGNHPQAWLLGSLAEAACSHRAAGRERGARQEGPCSPTPLTAWQQRSWHTPAPQLGLPAELRRTWDMGREPACGLQDDSAVELPPRLLPDPPSTSVKWEW